MKLAKLLKPNFLITAVFIIVYIVATCVLTFINKNIIQHCGTKPVKTGLKKLKVFNLHKSILVYFDREISSFARNRVRFLSETSTNSKHFGPMGTKLTLKQRPGLHWKRPYAAGTFGVVNSLLVSSVAHLDAEVTTKFS